MGGDRPRRAYLKAHHPDWKDKLRENCLKRVKEERIQLLWNARSIGLKAPAEKGIVESEFRDIVSDELQKIKDSSRDGSCGISASKSNDLLWDYEGFPMDANSSESENEELMLEMERVLYEDLREEVIRKELELYEEEDEYLARAVFDHMHLSDDQLLAVVIFQCILRLEVCYARGKERQRIRPFVSLTSFYTDRQLCWKPCLKVCNNNKLWCPICKQGELREALHLIYCTCCKLRLDLQNDKVNLDLLRNRLGDVHRKHFDRGCKAMPKFSMETIFDLTALYIQCEVCDTFEIVL